MRPIEDAFARRILSDPKLSSARPVVIRPGPLSRSGPIGGPEVCIILLGAHRLTDELDQARAAAIHVARECFAGLPFRLVVAAADEDRAHGLLLGAEILGSVADK